MTIRQRLDAANEPVFVKILRPTLDCGCAVVGKGVRFQNLRFTGSVKGGITKFYQSQAKVLSTQKVGWVEANPAKFFQKNPNRLNPSYGYVRNNSYSYSYEYALQSVTL